MADKLGIKILFDYQQSYKELEGIINKINKQKVNIPVGFGSGGSGSGSSKNATAKPVKEMSDALIELQKNLNAVGKFDISKTPIEKGMKVIGYSTKEAGKYFETFTQSLNNGQNQIVTYSGNMNKLTGNLELTGKTIRQTNRENNTFVKDLGIALKRITEWAIATYAIYGSLRKLKEGYTFVYELSNSLNEIRIVTNKSVDEVNKLAKSYNDLAIAMGSTTSEITKSSVEYYRQGLNQEETNKRTEATIKYAKISNLAMEESTDIITASANATKRDVNQIIDVFALLGDSSASGADEVGRAMQKSAAAAEGAGVSFEKLAAWETTISSVTREAAENIGNSMKSMMVRYQQIREKGFNEEDATNLNMVTKALATVGIKAVDTQGNLRDFQDILDELAPRWKTLTDKQQDYIQTQMAGIYQANRFAALMNNYSDSIKYYELALNSAGTAQKKFDIYLESNEAKANIFKSTMDKLWMNTFNSESIGNLIEFGTSFVETVDKVGLLNIAIILISGTLIIFSKNIMTGLVAVKDFITAMTTLDFTLTAANPIISAIVIAIGLLAIAYINAKSSSEKFQEQIDKNNKEIENQKNTIESLIQKIDGLNKANDALVNSNEDLYDIYKQIKEINPDIVDGLDLQTASVMELKNALYSAKIEAMESQAAIASLASKDAYLTAKQGYIIDKQVNAKTGVVRDVQKKLSDKEIKEYERIAKEQAQQASVIRNSLNGNPNEVEFKRFDKAYTPSTNTNHSSGKTSSAEKEIADTILKADRYSEYNAELERTNSLLTKNKALQENVSGEKLILTLKEEQTLLKQKQDNLNSINIERRKERNEVAQYLKSQGALFKGEGDLMSVSNAQLILQKKLDEVNAHRGDKNKTLYNQLKAQYDNLNDSVKRFVDLQTKEIPQTSADWWNLQKAIGQTGESIVKLNETQQKNLEDVQSQITEVIKKRYEIERDEAEKTHKDKLDQLDEELSTFKDNIDEQLDALDKLYDKQNFEKNQDKSTDKISELTTERNTLSMAAQSGDLTAISRIAEIDKEITEQREKLAELQSDREHELRKENLQDALDAKEKEIKSAKDAADDEFEIVKANYERLLEQGNLNAEANKALTTGMVTDINGKLVTVAEAFKTFSDTFGKTLGTLGSNIQTEFIDKLNQALQLINTMSGLPANTGISNVNTSDLSNSTFSGNLLSGTNLSSLLSKIDISKIVPNLSSFKMPSVSTVGGNNSNVNISVPVSINGSADKSIALDIGNTVAKIIRQELNKSGIYRS